MVVNIFDDPLFTPYLGNLAAESVAKERAIKELSYRFAPLMNKIVNSSPPQLLDMLEDGIKGVAENPPTSIPTLQTAVKDVLRVLDELKVIMNGETAPEARSYKSIADEHDAYASTDEQGKTVFERRGVTLERERGWKGADQYVRVRTHDPDTINEIHREFKSGIGESEYSSVQNLGIRGAHNYWKFSGSKQAGQQELG